MLNLGRTQRNPPELLTFRLTSGVLDEKLIMVAVIFLPINQFEMLLS